jgi:hypothetical protein
VKNKPVRSASTAREIAEWIQAYADELAIMASKAGLNALARVLRMASLEAASAQVSKQDVVEQQATSPLPRRRRTSEVRERTH